MKRLVSAIVWLTGKFTTVTAWLVLSYLALLAFGVIVNMLLNNATLRTFERHFTAVAHPASSESLATSSRTGNLGCASNHCDYFVGNLRSTSLSREALLAHYGNMTIPSPPDPYFEEPTEIQLWFFEKEVPECEPEVDRLFNEPENWRVDLSEYADKTLYIAFAEAAGAPPGADIRCH